MDWNTLLSLVQREHKSSSLFIHCNPKVFSLHRRRNDLVTLYFLSWWKKKQLFLTSMYWKPLLSRWKTKVWLAHLNTRGHGEKTVKTNEESNSVNSLSWEDNVFHCDGTLCGGSGNKKDSFVKYLLHVSFPKHVANRLEVVLDSMESDIRVPIFAALLFIVALVGRYFGLRKYVTTVLLGICFVVGGLPALDDTICSLKARDVNIDVLMTAAAVASVVQGSLVEGTLLVLLYSLSHIAEKKVQQFATKRLDSLRDNIPQTALCVGTSEKLYDSPCEVSLSQVKPGDWILVRAGEIAPCDGIVRKGSAFVTREHFNGESVPYSVGEGTEVLSGSRTLDGSLVLEVSRMSSESTLQKILFLVAEAQRNRPPIQVWVDRFGSLYSKLILLISFCIISFLSPLSVGLWGKKYSIAFWGSGGSLSRGLGFLVTTSPCALVIGAPVAYLSCLSVAASRGVFIKGGAKSIENISGCNHFAFDKTGTLTRGSVHLVRIMTYSPQCSQPEIVWNISQDNMIDQNRERQYSCMSNASCCQHVGWEEALSFAASLERGSVHPFAKAVQIAAENAKLELDIPMEYHAVSGLGLSGTFQDGQRQKKVWFGRLTYVMEYLSLEQSFVSWLESKLDEVASRGESVAILADSNGKIAIFCFVDQIRPETVKALSLLQREQARITILTGDTLAATSAIMDKLPKTLKNNIEILHSLTPKSKLDWISQYSKEKKSGLVMVGDGMNDAPALAAATTGVVLGLASATAVQAADIILVQPDLTRVVWLWKIAKCTKRIVIQNIVFALMCMVVASFASVLGTMPLWLAVIVHEGSTILVGCNGLRLLLWQRAKE
ncbi:hypothetical protein GAYE_SCF19G3968 [Galdieria yellowstonensis]|uniref:P-type ATPase A domain-containing protein n=1 Tax=Galdieria yellowstonensis TaxID=3028027 RepID=A0AAV9IF78_9RHOD|nr:hypothetical protein GAYE_SCF19G3968 [Galdieria yellowstonensis]